MFKHIFSSCKSVLSCVPQDLILGPVLFIIYINHLTSRVLKIADDTKLYRAIASNHDILSLSSDINKLCCWSKEWQMLLNVEKCKVMHIGANNPKYYIQWAILLSQKLVRRRIWGVIFTKDLKAVSNCVEVVKLANRILENVIFRTKVFKLYFHCINLWLDLKSNIAYRPGDRT